MSRLLNGDVTLADKYVRQHGCIFLTGVQALVRLPLMQRARDAARGLNTAGFVTGYRGSPLGTYDMALMAAGALLPENQIHFHPGLNEELAATSVWGTQQLVFQPSATVEGVFAIWYGKGPGVDRAMDALKHANAAGTAPRGGVLAVFGDDHGAQSSTLLHQSEPMFEAAGIPVLNPSDVGELVTFGLWGFELSRFAGCWVGLKATTEVVDTSATIDATPPPLPQSPADFTPPPGGLGIRWPDTSVEQERRMLGPRLEAIAAFARANPVDREIYPASHARLGIVTTGKAHADVMQALQELGIGAAEAAVLGLAIYKVGLSWPVEPDGLRRFASGLDEILVVEEKRAFIEPQILSVLRHMPKPPRIVGKSDETGEALLPSCGELTPALAAVAILSRLKRTGVGVAAYERRGQVLDVQAGTRLPEPALRRPAFFCSGCPHNSSTKTPEGSRAMAGTGCHSMAMAVPSRNTQTLTQMGGEGVNWIGQAPFVNERHVFVNLGDGTYSHSGFLAIRAAAAAGVNVTYKILYNDAVAMTGGQSVDAHLSVSQIAHELIAEGAKRVAVLAEQPSRHNRADFPKVVEILDRSELARVQREMREQRGLTAIIYDQVCAAEKRRRRKRKLYPQATKRVFINEEVCEACGDCSVQSNCISVVPKMTSLGAKRSIDQSSCNADYSCVNGFCPSFVTIEGATPKTQRIEGRGIDGAIAALTLPALPHLENPYNILVTGIGGTGVITLGALLGMAAHLEGKVSSVLDFTGLAQKNGAVTSQIRIASVPQGIAASRIVAGTADLLLACDVVVATATAQLSRLGAGRTRAVVNTHVQPPAAFVLDPDLSMDNRAMLKTIGDVVGDNAITAVNATRITTKLMGDSIFANVFLLGCAWQRGEIPLSREALMRAIELNGAAVEKTKRAFALGRVATSNAAYLEKITEEDAAEDMREEASVDEIIADRHARLVAYQDARYADRFDALCDAADRAERAYGFLDRRLTRAVAHNFYKLMAYKDEYEVARLHTDGGFRRKLGDQFENIGRVMLYLAPPFIARRDPVTGHPRKIAFGPWIWPVLRALTRFKVLRGTPFDPFGYTAERRLERELIDRYEKALRSALVLLRADNRKLLIELAELPDAIRGYGHIKQKNFDRVAPRFVALATALASAGVGNAVRTSEKELA